MSNASAIPPNRARRGSHCAGALALVAATLALPHHVNAAPENKIAISYEVEVGSMSAMSISYKAALSGQTYQSTASIRTQGLASMFSDYQMDMTASGSFDDDGIKPGRYRSKTEKKSKEKVHEITWPGDNPPAVTTTPKDEKDEKLLAPALTAGLVDPLSMVLRLAALHAGKPCRSVERMVDGQGVYDFRFALAGEVKLGADSPGVYRGRAFKCSMTYMPVGGKPAIKFRKKGGVPQAFDVWFAPITSDGSDVALFVPVLATGKLQGLRFVAYARKGSIGGQSIAAKQD